MHDTPHAPRRIALVNGDPRGDAGPSAALLTDLSDALLAYEHQSARELGVASVPPDLMRYGLDQDGGITPVPGGTATRKRSSALKRTGFLQEKPPTPEPAAGSGPADRPDENPGGSEEGADSLVLAYSLDTERQPLNLFDELKTFAEEGGLVPHGLVYAVCTAGAGSARQAPPRLSHLSDWCASYAATWCGALVVEDGARAAWMAGLPRMGLARRNVSEAMDRLVAAVRAGLTVRQAARIFGATRRQAELAERGIIRGRYPLPAAMLAAGYFRSR